MAATNVNLNWTNVSFAGTPVIRVTSMTFDQGGELISFTGDDDRYPTVIANTVSRPKVSLTSGDVASLMSIAVNAQGTVSATQKDGLGASGGDIIWTMQHCVHETTADSGQWGQFASATSSWQAYSIDGHTTPLSLARA